MTIESIERFGTTRRYSDAVAHGNTVYLVEVAQSLDADIATQTREVLASVRRSLQLAQRQVALLQVTIYLADIGEIAAMNAVWDDWVPEGCAPVRACVERVWPILATASRLSRLRHADAAAFRRRGGPAATSARMAALSLRASLHQ